MTFTQRSFIFVIFAALITAVPFASATTCSNATLNGVYGVLSSGLNGSLLPATTVVQVTFNGAGTASGTATGSSDGTIQTETFTGTYSVASNCTGTISWTNANGKVLNANFVMNSSNKGAFAIETDASHLQTMVVTEQGTATCTNKGVKKTYSLELTGTDLSVGQIGVVGQLVLNGTGTITGKVTLSLYGTIVNDVSVTGTYSISSNCTGTATITPEGQSAINLSLVVVNSDKQILAVETDNNTVVSGMLLE